MHESSSSNTIILMTPASETRYIIEHATAYYKLIGITSFIINSIVNNSLMNDVLNLEIVVCCMWRQHDPCCIKCYFRVHGLLKNVRNHVYSSK